MTRSPIGASPAEQPHDELVGALYRLWIGTAVGTETQRVEAMTAAGDLLARIGALDIHPKDGTQSLSVSQDEQETNWKARAEELHELVGHLQFRLKRWRNVYNDVEARAERAEASLRGVDREVIARIIDPWAYGIVANITHTERASSDREKALAKADDILSTLQGGRGEDQVLPGPSERPVDGAP